MTYKYHFSIELPSISAGSYDEALIKAHELLSEMSVSFKGLKFLRNAMPTYRGCNYNANYLETPEHEP